MKPRLSIGVAICLLLIMTACSSAAIPKAESTSLPINPNADVDYSDTELERIYLAGGCFWGVEAFFARIYGVSDVTSGYANGTGDDPTTYKEVLKGDRAFAETVEITYNPQRVTLTDLLSYFFKIIDPVLLNQQGNDKGIQYRTGIYFDNEKDLPTIEDIIKNEQKKYDDPIVTEVLPLTNYFLAEDYHQEYLENNPDGYCHIDLSILNDL